MIKMTKPRVLIITQIDRRFQCSTSFEKRKLVLPWISSVEMPRWYSIGIFGS